MSIASVVLELEGGSNGTYAGSYMLQKEPRWDRVKAFTNLNFRNGPYKYMLKVKNVLVCACMRLDSVEDNIEVEANLPPPPESD